MCQENCLGGDGGQSSIADPQGRPNAGAAVSLFSRRSNTAAPPEEVAAGDHLFLEKRLLLTRRS